MTHEIQSDHRHAGARSAAWNAQARPYLGLGQNDTLSGGGTLTETVPGSPTLLGEADRLLGGAGDDLLWGEDNLVPATGGTARLTGGHDTLSGEAGNDTLYGDGAAGAGFSTGEILGAMTACRVARAMTCSMATARAASGAGAAC